MRRSNGHTITAMHEMSTTPPPPRLRRYSCPTLNKTDVWGLVFLSAHSDLRRAGCDRNEHLRIVYSALTLGYTLCSCFFVVTIALLYLYNPPPALCDQRCRLTAMLPLDGQLSRNASRDLINTDVLIECFFVLLLLFCFFFWECVRLEGLAVFIQRTLPTRG